MDLVKFVEEQSVVKNQFPVFKAGDTVSVHYKIREGNKERSGLPGCCFTT
jgi:large subunit ribosomal protein L19